MGIRYKNSLSSMAYACLMLMLTTSAHANLLVPENSSLSLPSGGTLDLSCGVLDVQGDLALNDAEVSGISDVGISSGGQLDAGAGVLQISGSWTNLGTFLPGNSTVLIDASCSTAPVVFSGITVFNNLTIIADSARSVVLPSGTPLTVNGTLTLTGTDTAPLQLTSADGGLAVINLGPDAEVIRSNVQVASNVQIGLQSSSIAAIPSLGLLSLVIMSLLMTALGSSHLLRRTAA